MRRSGPQRGSGGLGVAQDPQRPFELRDVKGDHADPALLPLREDHRMRQTKMLMAVCPFCEPGQTWPDDILAVHSRRVVEVVPFNVPLRATGTLELGDHVDPELGSFSKVRLVEATYVRG